MSELTIFTDRNLTLLAVAVLVHKLGGTATLTQADIDAVAYMRLEEQHKEGVVTLTLKQRTKQ